MPKTPLNTIFEWPERRSASFSDASPKRPTLRRRSSAMDATDTWREHNRAQLSLPLPVSHSTAGPETPTETNSEGSGSSAKERMRAWLWNLFFGPKK